MFGVPLIFLLHVKATLEGMASTFPGAFDGYTLSVEESHQVYGE
jgi:hypothetical protein